MGGSRGRLINLTDRNLAVSFIDEAIQNGARQSRACLELNISERTYTRWKNPQTPMEDQRPLAKRPVPANKLSREEQLEILEIVTSATYKSLPPSQIVPRLADEEGRYLASESTFYRVLREENMQHHRGRTAKPQTRPISTHKATGPNQVWMWDITWLPSGVKGFYYYLYLILDRSLAGKYGRKNPPKMPVFLLKKPLYPKGVCTEPNHLFCIPIMAVR